MRYSAFKLLAMPILASLAVALAAARPTQRLLEDEPAKASSAHARAIRASSKIEHRTPSELIGTEVREEGERTFEMNISTDGAQPPTRSAPSP